MCEGHFRRLVKNNVTDAGGNLLSAVNSSMVVGQLSSGKSRQYFSMSLRRYLAISIMSVTQCRLANNSTGRKDNIARNIESSVPLCKTFAFSILFIRASGEWY